MVASPSLCHPWLAFPKCRSKIYWGAWGPRDLLIELFPAPLPVFPKCRNGHDLYFVFLIDVTHCTFIENPIFGQLRINILPMFASNPLQQYESQHFKVFVCLPLWASSRLHAKCFIQ